MPPSYAIEIGRCFEHLIKGGIRCVSTCMPSLTSIRYDRLHMSDLPFNRTLMIKYLKSEQLESTPREKASFLDPDPEERMKIVYQYPNLAQFKFALSKTPQVPTNTRTVIGICSQRSNMASWESPN